MTVQEAVRKGDFTPRGRVVAGRSRAAAVATSRARTGTRNSASEADRVARRLCCRRGATEPEAMPCGRPGA